MITCGSVKDSGVAVGLRKTYLISRSTADISLTRENVETDSGKVRGSSGDENVLRARLRSRSWTERTRTERTRGRRDNDTPTKRNQ